MWQSPLIERIAVATLPVSYWFLMAATRIDSDHSGERRWSLLKAEAFDHVLSQRLSVAGEGSPLALHDFNNQQDKMVELTSNPLALLFQATGIRPISAPKPTPF